MFRTLTTMQALIIACALSGAAAAQSIQSTLFGDTDELMQQALDADADVLSPGNFAAARDAYIKAEGYLGKGRADKATRELQKANASLSKAIEISKLGQVTFEDALRFRDLANDADARTFAPDLWAAAEGELNSAAISLEAGNIRKAQAAATRALTDYGRAELEAIKTAILGTARTMLAEAEAVRVDRHAPITLANARALIGKAERDLTENRYATAEPQLLAAEAEYEVRHASYIAGQVQTLDAGLKTTEQLILEWERPLRDVAAALAVPTDMSAGYEPTASAAREQAARLTEQNVELTARLNELETTLGGTAMLVEETQRLQRQLAEVEDLFGPGQARVLREGNDLIIRLVGLSFPPGQAFIETQYFGLLTKVQDVMDIFPESNIVLEGHTDAYAADTANANLSRERADAVREYLLANGGLPESRISSIGYGKSSPMASNDTAEGRALNRRVDIVIIDASAPQTAQQARYRR